MQINATLPANKERNQGIQLLRAIAATLVVIQHVIWYSLEHFKIDPISVVNKYHIGSMGVGIFFVISGFVITLSLHQNKMFLLYRMIRIYPPFWFLVIVSFFFIKDVTITIDSFLLLPSPSANFNYSYRIPYWTLVYEMFFYSIIYATILLKFSKERLLQVIVFWILVIIIYNMIKEVYTPVPYLRIFFSPINIFFIFGVCIALNRDIYLKIPNYQLILVVIIGFQFLQLTSATLYHTVQALTCSAILLLFIKIEKTPQFFIMIGNSSYGLYLIHDLGIIGTIYLIKKYGISVKLYPLCLISFVLSMIVGIAYGYVEYKFHKNLVNWLKQKYLRIKNSES